MSPPSRGLPRQDTGEFVSRDGRGWVDGRDWYVVRAFAGGEVTKL